MKLTEFVIDNCVRQSATEPKDYIGMTWACDYGRSLFYKIQYGVAPGIRMSDILVLGQRVNDHPDISWRNVTARFNNGNEGAPYSEIPRLIEQLLEMQKDITPEEFYWEFERIHPFIDGNGRVGAILYNVLLNDRETMLFWVNPPDMTW